MTPLSRPAAAFPRRGTALVVGGTPTTAPPEGLLRGH